MAAKKKTSTSLKHSPLLSKAPLSQRPYVTMALLAILTCALALTVELIQNAQVLEARSKASVPAVRVQNNK
ncbi:hypothetical protein A2397_00150 [Candidatus Amesbacteria bacterium RIFOXYB1_FULL_44_23]|uniref:Uncharacterized protein n=1 Tax=Candidatus Amesbacteria bacterium RIFOXYB1_FULL_44_23 TaxID=1797263 RepID=A0A1F4ZYW4_9BACT|nr:MAG: hypothetical protein A2397_00150 [Candidatus Amesbacteria bacterium RIFOXYB1_FULL_44_23]